MTCVSRRRSLGYLARQVRLDGCKVGEGGLQSRQGTSLRTVRAFRTVAFASLAMVWTLTCNHPSLAFAAQQRGEGRTVTFTSLPADGPPVSAPEPDRGRRLRGPLRLGHRRLPPPGKTQRIELPPVPPAQVFTAMTYVDGPPDIAAALGPEFVVVATNALVRVLRRSGELMAVKQTYGLFKGFVFDPSVVRDPLSGRWVITACTRFGVAVAVSGTQDPRGKWLVRDIGLDLAQGWWFDQPRLALQEHGLLVCGTLIGPDDDSPRIGRCLRLPLDQLWGDGDLTQVIERSALPPILWPADDPDRQLATPLAVDAYTDLDGLHLRAVRLRPEDLVPLASQDLWLHRDASNQLNDAPQPGGLAADAGMTRTRCVARLGQLWCTWNALIDDETVLLAGTAQGDRPMTLFDLDMDSTAIRIYPSLAVSPAGDVVIGYSRFSADSFASAAYVVHLAGDPTGSLRPEVVAKAGVAAYADDPDQWGRVRWGDYSATLADPVEADRIWTFQEYAELPISAASRYGIAATEVRLPCDVSACGACQRCEQGKCVPAPADAVCSDGDLCTTGDHCTGGGCVGTPRVCPESAPCVSGFVCRPSDGACVPQPVPGQPACDDGDRCTRDDRCTQGSCLGKPLVCPADSCHLSYCSSVSGSCVTKVLARPACLPVVHGAGCTAVPTGEAAAASLLLAGAGLALWQRRRQRRILLLALAVLALGLGGCGEPEDPRLRAVATYRQFLNQMHAQACQGFAQCPVAHDVFADMSHCAPYLRLQFSPGPLEIDPNSHYSATAGLACLDWLADRLDRCSLFWSHTYTEGPCAGVLRGDLPGGASCSWLSITGSECASGACVNYYPPCSGQILRMCLPVAASNTPCTNDKGCVAPEYCLGGRCQGQIDDVAIGHPCDAMRRCGPLSSCVGPDGKGICVAMTTQVGAPCNNDDPALADCAYPLRCKPASGPGTCGYWATDLPCTDDGSCDARTVCKEGRCSLKPRLGEACLPTQGCRERDTACRKLNGKLVCAPALPVGADCSDGTGDRHGCGEGLECWMSKCRAPGAAGALCSPELPCQYGLICLDKVCQVPSSVGGPCHDRWDCVPHLTCLAKNCAPPPGLNASCGPDSECAANLVCRGGLCGPLLGPGEPCTWDGDCLAGLECSGSECTVPICDP